MTTNDLNLLTMTDLEARRDALLASDGPRVAAELREVESFIEARLEADYMSMIGELEADYGASLYYGGLNATDAMIEARAYIRQRIEG